MIADIWQPFADYGFMRRALAGCLTLSAGAAPLGTILLLRRMSLVGDAMSHAILPGAALGYLFFGLSLTAMTLGGLLAGVLVALLSGVVTRHTALREDASFAGFYLISLALGVLLISLRGSNVDLLHVLFGSVLALDDPTSNLISFSTPSTGDGTSRTTLSVSRSSRFSSRLTASPTFLCQVAMVPSATDSGSTGALTSVAMRELPGLSFLE